MVPERQTQAQAETAEGLRQARARDTLSRLARAPSGLDTHASVHQAGRQLEEVPQARVGPDPGEETDHVQTQPSEDLTPTPLASPPLMSGSGHHPSWDSTLGFGSFFYPPLTPPHREKTQRACLQGVSPRSGNQTPASLWKHKVVLGYPSPDLGHTA